LETIRSVTCTPDEKAYAYSLIDASTRTHQTAASAGKARLTYIRRFKAKKVLTGEKRVAERLINSRCFGSISSKPGGKVVDILMSAMEDKRLEVSITAVAKAPATPECKADKPRKEKPDKPSGKHDKPDNNKAKPKERKGGRFLHSSHKAHKKTEADYKLE
jgi:ribosomal protein L12E/L44/L45/RPP1/RPP2